jgi:hypothetical protein
VRVSMAASFLLASLMFAGCHSTPSKPVNEIHENRASITVADLPQKCLDGFDASSRSSIKEKLLTQDSLTLDGTTLTIGDVGANTTVSLAFNKFKMINGARIVTNGNHLNLYAMEMDFNNNGGIDSFYGNTLNAKPDTAGANGGGVEIYAVDSVYGSLRVSLPGQIGGAGSKGATGDNGSPGPRGSNGSDKAFGCGSGGSDGGKGGAGRQGSTGSPGQPGGNGGDLVLHAAASKDYNTKFPYDAPPGMGGKGGSGGDGGNGGPGGEGGSGTTYCGGGHGGAQGDHGAAGAGGADGSAGSSPGKRDVK